MVPVLGFLVSPALLALMPVKEFGAKSAPIQKKMGSGRKKAFHGSLDTLLPVVS